MELNALLVVASPMERLKVAQIFSHFPSVNLQKECTSAVEACEYLKYNKVDFIALQPDLPDNDGFEFISQLNSRIDILLISKNPSDALRAYELGLLDCLPLDFSAKRLQISLDRIAKKNRQKPNSLVTDGNSLVVRCNLKNEKVTIDTILWIEAMGDYVRIVTHKKKLVILSSMKEFLRRLPSKQFIRTHKSFIINLDKVQYFKSTSVEIDGQSIPLSRSRKKEFEKTFLLHQ